MTRGARTLWTTAAAAGVLTAGLTTSPAQADEVECSATCPEGTQIVSFSGTEWELLANGAFLWVEERCEATCAPIIPCHWPNIPTATKEAGFTCQPLTGFSTLPDDPDVDLSWGSNFDPALAVPPEPGAFTGRLVVTGEGFGAFEGDSVFVGLGLVPSQIYSVLEATITSGGFEMDFSGSIPAGIQNLLFFVDEDEDRSCGAETMWQLTLDVPATGIPRQEVLTYGAPEYTTNGGMCPLVETMIP